MTSPYEPSGPAGPSFTPPSGDVTSDDKLWALLAYVLSPLIPIVILLMEDKKNRPFLKAHYYQALALGILEVILQVLSGLTVCITGVLGLALWIYEIYLGIQAYNGKYVTIPFVTDFVKQQGWS